jgi:hypothetical protein
MEIQFGADKDAKADYEIHTQNVRIVTYIVKSQHGSYRLLYAD